MWDAIDSGDVSKLTEAIKNGASLGATTGDVETTPLLHAVSNDRQRLSSETRRDVIIALIRGGADVDEDVDGFSPLSAALLGSGGPDVLELLLAAGATPNRTAFWRGQQVDDLLQFAVAFGLVDAASLFLAANATWSQSAMAGRGDGDACGLSAWIAVASHPTIAAKELQLAGFAPCRRRAFEICVGLHDLELPAPLLIAIVQIDCEPFSLPLPYHLFWNACCAVKHFRTRDHAPAVELAAVDLIEAARAQRIRILTEYAHKFEELLHDTTVDADAFAFVIEAERRVLGEDHKVTQSTLFWRSDYLEAIKETGEATCRRAE